MNIMYRISAIIGVVALFLILITRYNFWHNITVIYIILSNFFVWTTLAMWCLADLKTKKNKIDFNERFTIIMSVFNEDPRKLYKSIATAVLAKGDKEIIIGDDGSDISIEPVINAVKKNYPKTDILFLRSDENIGKKNMQAKLIRKAKHDYIINMDSDIVVEDNSFIRLLFPLLNEKVGISNARLIMLGEDKKPIKRIQGVLYFCANQIGRKSTGNLGIMPCASGELLAFRKGDFIDVLEKYENCRWLNHDIKYGEDRRMTNMLLEKGLKSVYVENSIAYTYPKETLKDFIKQQLRWRRSWIRETVYAWRFGWKKPIFFYEITALLFLGLTFSILTITLLTYGILTFNILPFIGFFMIIMLTTVIRNVPYLFEHKFRSGDLLLYALFNFLFIMPLWPYAFVTMDNGGWGTRKNGSLKNDKRAMKFLFSLS